VTTARDERGAPPLRELAARLRDGRSSARDLAEEALAADRLGAYREVDPAATRRQADAADAALRAGRDLGPLQGVTVSIKDLYGVPGYGTFAGSPRRLPARFELAGTLVRTLLAQLAVVTGKTHTVEFAFGGLGTNPHHPTPVNPWDARDHRAPGGSTSGGGVSLAEGSALLALGTDTAGSVRIPAAWTGNAALKTTRGRWATDGIVPLSPTLDTAGVLARTVDDLAYAFEALDPARPLSSGPALDPPELSSVTLGRCDAVLFEGCSPGVVEAVDRALADLAGAGARVAALDLPEISPALDLFRRGGPVSIELHRFLSAELPDWISTLDPNVRARIGDAAALPPEEYADRLRAMRALAASAGERLRGVDALACPTVASTPPRLADVRSPRAYAVENVRCLRNTAVVSYLCLCAVTVPAGLDAAGMPVGLQLVGRGGGDERLLALARAVERALGPGHLRLGSPPRKA
jgi:aspartyl-tRNA(Asn)/glutamyl-tRNA(Gln) amidotransferase subunit A